MKEILRILETINKETGCDVEVRLHTVFRPKEPGLEFRVHWGDLHFMHVFTHMEIKSIKDEEVLINYLIRKANKSMGSFDKRGKA